MIPNDFGVRRSLASVQSRRSGALARRRLLLPAAGGGMNWTHEHDILLRKVVGTLELSGARNSNRSFGSVTGMTSYRT